MGKVIYSVATSIDGFIALPDGSFDWLLPYPPDADFATGFLERIGGVLMGRTSFDLERSLQGTVHHDKRVAVMTRRPIEQQPANVVAFSSDVAEAVSWLREGEGDIWLYGGGDVAGQALTAGLIDEIHSAVVPVTLGKGLLLFGNAPSAPTTWTLQGSTRSSAGYLMQVYHRP